MLSKHVIGRHPPAAPVKLTIRLDVDADALLRHAASEWSLSQGDMVALALRVFAGCGALAAPRLVFEGAWQQRIDKALADAARSK